MKNNKKSIKNKRPKKPAKFRSARAAADHFQSRQTRSSSGKSRESGTADRKYDIEIPSREEILTMLDERGELMKLGHLAKAFDLDSDAGRTALSRRLNAMVRDGQLLENRRGGYGLSKKLDLIPGRVIGHPDGFGFVAPDRGGDDLYLSGREMRQVLHGDRVLVSVKGIDRRGRSEGAIVSVLERVNSHLVGRFYRESGVGFVIADEKRVSQNVLIQSGTRHKARNGDFVYLELIEQPSKRQPPMGRIIEVLGDRVNAAMAVNVAVRNYDLPETWPQAVQSLESDLPHQVSENETHGRKDLRQLPLVTIDGADAKDFDDAVYCEQSKSGWKLIVAIADVSHYVRPGSALDEEALNRGTSVYFPRRVIPMLPEALSNGICSLKPEVDRLCMVCEISYDDKGKVKRSRFYDAVMHSHARLTYDQVGRHLSGEKPLKAGKKVARSLASLHQLYRKLDRRRKKRGAMEFNSMEVSFEFDKRDEVKAIIPRERNDAHKLIEECMIAANVEAAKYLLKAKVPSPYRVHALPPEQKLDALRQSLGELGIILPVSDRVEPRVLSAILADSRDRPEYDMIQSLILRSMSLAVYTPANAGHFGLALDSYSHFTSPIRRYPDLLVHRAIRSTFKQTRQKDRYSLAEMEKLTSHCSMTERRAEDASREVDDRLKCAYMQAHVGDAFDGTVTGVKHFGLFVELDGLRISGLVHVTSLPNDYYHYDPVMHILTGERRRKQYRLGDKVRIEVARVNVDDREIDFVMAKKKDK